MADYVVYHKREKMGYPVIDVDRLASYTNKQVSMTGNSDDRIWLIAGEGRPTKYYLRASFIIGNVEKSNNPKFKKLVTGKDGLLFDPMPLISGEKWFSEFLKIQGNFGFGFNVIQQQNVLDGLRKILSAHVASHTI